jgi:hypothetical protein
MGTGLGCLTETRLFVEHMIQGEEATPKPRAFASSVHNAIASKVALELDARGECQTFVHGEVSFGQVLFAAALLRCRRPATAIVTGAVDETDGYVELGRRGCGVTETGGEGGAVRVCGGGGPLARITAVAYGRPAHAPSWLEAEFGEIEAGSAIFVPAITGLEHSPPGWVRAPWTGSHPSGFATATAIAIGVLAGECPPAALGLDSRRRRLTLAAWSRFGDCAAVRIEVA